MKINTKKNTKFARAYWHTMQSGVNTYTVSYAQIGRVLGEFNHG